MMDQGGFICTEVMLFINSTFHGNCQLERDDEEGKKITFVLSFAPKLVSTACDTEKKRFNSFYSSFCYNKSSLIFP